MSGVADWKCRKPHGPKIGGAEIGRSIGSNARTAPGCSSGAVSSPTRPMPMPGAWRLGDPKPSGDCECGGPGECRWWLGRPDCVGGGVQRWSSERVPSTASPDEACAALRCAARAACSPEAFAAWRAQSSPPTPGLRAAPPSGLSAAPPPHPCGGGVGEGGGGPMRPKLAWKAKRPLPLGSRMGRGLRTPRLPLPASLLPSSPAPSARAPDDPAEAPCSRSNTGADAGRSGSSIHGRHESSPASKSNAWRFKPPSVGRTGGAEVGRSGGSSHVRCQRASAVTAGEPIAGKEAGAS
mmetsp:Transcript_24907/g.63174  ORF Transcript_24907/g.63174 Transcript_24907/m.63174 type:complete len:295 (-) Transcript_24907:82-966(-)